MIAAKKITKFFSYFMVAILFCIAFSGCGSTSTSTNKTKLVVWSFENPDAWKSVINSFQQKYPSYTIDYEQQTLDDNYENRVLNSILSTNTPDVWAMPNDWVYRHKDKLAPMPAKAAATINMNTQFVPAIKESVEFNGNIYALSPSAEPLMIYYNPQLFSSTLNNIEQTSSDDNYKKQAETLLQNPPQLWDDVVSMAKLLTIKNGSTISQSGLAMGTSSIANSQDILYLLMMQNQTNIISSDLQLATFNLPKDTSTGANNVPGEKALEFYTSFANPASTNYTWNDSLGNDVDAFANGKVAMIFGYSSLSNELLQKYPDFQYKKAYAPQLSSDSSTIRDYARFNALGVNKLSQNSAAGWVLINMLTINNADDFNSYAGLYTSQKTSNYDTSIVNRIGNNPEKLELATADSLVKGRYPSDFDFYIRSAIAAVNNGSQNPQDALDLISSEITNLLRKGSW